MNDELQRLITELKQLRAAAEDGPFEYSYVKICRYPHTIYRVSHGNYSNYLYHKNEQHRANGRFMAAALNAIDPLLEAIEAMESEGH